MSFRFLGTVCIVHPRIGPVRLWVALQGEDFNGSFPNCLPLECLFYRHALQMGCFGTMQLMDCLFQFVNVLHDAASSRSATLQKSRSIPASIAGVQRMVVCRLTKL